MEVVTQPHIIPAASIAATIGMFDGVHRGHTMLIDTLNDIARAKGQKSAVITFRTHPQKVLRPDTDLQMIMPLDDRLQAIADAGADYVVLMDFDHQLAQLDSRSYIRLIRDNYGVSTLVTGFNHRFGHNRQEGFDDYRRHGIELGVELFQADEYRGPHSPVSSSIIRRLITAGKVDDAAKCLGHPFTLKGVVQHGFEVGREIGFPTANVGNIDSTVIIPHRGAYTVRVRVGSNPTPLGGMANIGIRPTIGNGNRCQSIEVHIFDFNGDIYGQPITVEFVRFLRTELKMGSLDELKAQLHDDRTRSLQILNQ
ncbi:MAG TPA: riboflavin biosynthesis protein RibF [Candidatus Avimuribaculum pullicola]|nr:riboflavin biosynthesis protein RibF [Candidatus Avimuribaculum pullicola]